MAKECEMVEIYTDGSCHTQEKIGGWAALIIANGQKTAISGIAQSTTHNRMELTAVIKSVGYVIAHFSGSTTIHIYTDSQYVAGLSNRKMKLIQGEMTTKKGSLIQNADLITELWTLEEVIEMEFTKVKAHQKKGETINHNIEVDKMARALVRKALAGLGR
jgi:ribonuclease HI